MVTYLIVVGEATSWVSHSSTSSQSSVSPGISSSMENTSPLPTWQRGCRFVWAAVVRSILTRSLRPNAFSYIFKETFTFGTTTASSEGGAPHSFYSRGTFELEMGIWKKSHKAGEKLLSLNSECLRASLHRCGETYLWLLPIGSFSGAVADRLLANGTRFWI